MSLNSSDLCQGIRSLVTMGMSFWLISLQQQCASPWEGIVGGLRHVVIGMNRVFTTQIPPASSIPVGNHFIGVHIRLGATTCLPDAQWKVIIQLAGKPPL